MHIIQHVEWANASSKYRTPRMPGVLAIWLPRVQLISVHVYLQTALRLLCAKYSTDYYIS